MKVLGFGAILWDDIRKGDRKVSAASVAGEENIGGAVFNVIVHMRKLGCEAYMLSALGKDCLGEKTFGELKRLQIHEDFISTVDASTCLIPVTFDTGGFPHYTIPESTSWDHINAGKSDIAAIDRLNFDFLIYGTLEQRNAVSRACLRAVLENAGFRNTYVDLTLRGGFYDRDLLDYSMRKATIVKMNDEEAQEVNRIFGFGQTRIEDLIPLLAAEFDNDVVCITAGTLGAYAGDRSGVFYRKAYKVTVNDTVGAGDAFGAGLLFKLGTGASLEDACDFGNKMGALISSKKSSVPDYDLSELDIIRENLNVS